MRLFRQLDDDFPCRGGCVSIGNFDGVHRGHRAMLARLVERANDAGVPAIVLTFDPHPLRLLRPDVEPPRLTTLEHRTELLGACGVECVVAYPTDAALLALTPEEFFDDVVRRRLAARGLVEGPNFRFGRNRAGDVTTLATLCERAGIALDVVEPVLGGEELVSSSRVRSLLRDGKLDDAVALLGHPYRLEGTVVSGAARGRGLGFPTANLTDVPVLLPGPGVYAGRAIIGDDAHPAAVNVGGNPTFDDATPKVEVHLLDFTGDLYGHRLAVDLLSRVRDVRSFENPEALRRQIADDVAAVRRIAGEVGE